MDECCEWVLKYHRLARNGCSRTSFLRFDNHEERESNYRTIISLPTGFRESALSWAWPLRP